MSLFGESPTEASPLQSSLTSKSLFGEQVTPAATSTSSLFADDSSNASPWSMPTPKKVARQSLIKNLLPTSEVPESYVDAYDAILNSNERSGSGVGLTGVKNVLASSGLNASDQEAILNLVVPGGQEPATGLGRSEFNVLLALVGLGQEGEDVTLDGVDERRRRLPQPKVSYLDKLRSQASQGASSPAPPQQQPIKETHTPRPVRKIRQDSLGGDPSSDPWASPAARGPPPSSAAHTLRSNGAAEDSTKPASNGLSNSSLAYRSRSEQPAQSGAPTGTSPSAGGAWNSYNGSSGGGFSEPPLIGGGFGESGDDQASQPGQNPQRSVTASTAVSQGTGEIVTITMLPEKEGMFLFQHNNYEVKSIRRASSVVRRYSDFVWLLDCLQKKYPFRRLPLLPPKRVQVNGTHLAGDISSFLEKRRRGLVRFTNALVQHPVLSQEQLFVMFLTVPTHQELNVWRKQAAISIQEEFVGKALPPTLEDSLPLTLPELFEQVRVGVKRSCEIYINLCALMERLSKRNEGLAADSLRFSLALQSLTESSADTYAFDTNDVPLLNEGINATAKHLSASQALLEDEAKAWDTGALEDLKRQRDTLVSMRDLFDRRDRLAKDNIPQLERRIEASEAKLQQLRGKPAEAVKPGELEKVESSIISDKESIVQQHARGVFIKECVRDEIVTFQSSVYAVSRLHQDWSQERVKYAELQASNWRSLVDDVESMPVNE